MKKDSLQPRLFILSGEKKSSGAFVLFLFGEIHTSRDVQYSSHDGNGA
jgi:hypothetical protein